MILSGVINFRFTLTQLLIFCFASGLSPGLQAESGSPVEEETQTEVLKLSGFEPLYFLYGSPSSKVKVSFKYQLIHELPLYLGFNQFVFWNIGRDSNPFQDVTYSPEIFYRLSFKGKAFFQSLDLIPYWHMSNGKGGSDSRSLDRSAVQLNTLPFPQNSKLKLSLRLSSSPYYMDLENYDVREYIGPFELRSSYTEVPLGPLSETEVSFRYFTGGAWGQKLRWGGRELGFSFRLGFARLNPSFYVQYFEGHAESLLNYTDYDRIIRVGLKL